VVSQKWLNQTKHFFREMQENIFHNLHTKVKIVWLGHFNYHKDFCKNADLTAKYTRRSGEHIKKQKLINRNPKR
jgi:hypothetical protein